MTGSCLSCMWKIIHKYGITWMWVNNYRIVIFGWTFPLIVLLTLLKKVLIGEIIYFKRI